MRMGFVVVARKILFHPIFGKFADTAIGNAQSVVTARNHAHTTGIHEYFIRDENDIYIEAPITITEAVLGCKKEIPTLYGNVTLTIPAGSESGEKHRIKGKGINNETTRKKGDMYIVLKIVTPKKLSKEQIAALENFLGML